MQGMRRLWFIPLAALVILAAASLIGVARPEAARGDSTQTDMVTTIGHGVVTAVPDVSPKADSGARIVRTLPDTLPAAAKSVW